MVKVRSDRGLSRALHEKQKDALKRWRYDNPYRTVEDLREELAFHAETTSDLAALGSNHRTLFKVARAGQRNSAKRDHQTPGQSAAGF